VTGLGTFSGGLTSTAGTTTLGTTTIGAITGTSATFSSTLGVSGITTLGATNSMTVSAAGVVSIASTLGVTGLGTFSGGLTSTAGTTTLGTTTIGAITGTSATFSSTLGVTGLGTFSGGLTSTASTTTLGTTTIGAITGTSATFSSTLGVSGITTIGSSTAATISAAGILTINNTTDSSSVSTGSIINLGGLGVAKSAYFGGPLDILSAKSGTPSTTGSYLRISASTFTDNVTVATGTAASMVFNSIAVPTLAATSNPVTTTNAATLYIAGGPATGTNQVITNSYGIWNVGNERIDGLMRFTGTTTSTSNTTGILLLAGGIGISNITDAASSTNGGTITTAGGAAIAKKLFVGTDLSVSGITTLGATNSMTVSAAGVVSIGNTLSVTGLGTFSGGLTSTVGTTTLGTTTIGAITGTSATFSSTLGVTGLGTFSGGLTSTAGTTTLGTTTIGAITGTSATFSSTLGVSGITTLGATNSMTVSAAGVVSIASTLGVTGLGTFSGGLTSTAGTTTLGITTIGAITGTSATFSSTLGVSGILTINNATASTSTITGALVVSGGIGIAGTVYANSANFVTLTAPHSGLSGLTNDDHTQYTLLAGRSGGQTITGGTLASNNLTLRSTSNITKGSILIDETTASTSTTTGALVVSGGVGIAGTIYANSANFVTLTAPHSGLSGLTNDDHTQYTLLAGRSGGQTLTGGTSASNSLTLRSTSNATKGQIFLDETTASTSTTTGALRVSGGTGIAGKMFVGGGITIDGDNTAFTVDALSNGRLGIVKKAGVGPYFATGSASSFDFRVSSATSIENVASNTYTSLATLTTTGTYNLLLNTSIGNSNTITGSGGTLNINGDITLYNATKNTIVFRGPGAGSAAPTFSGSNRSNGTKIVLYPSIAASAVDYALGIENASMWFSIEQATSSFNYYWYGGTTRILTLRGDGQLTVSGTTDSTSSTTGSLLLSGGVGISSTTDATSATNGGTLTSAGGGAFAKSLYVGGPLDILSSKSGTPSTTGQYLRISASTFTDNNTATSGTAASMVFNSIAIPTLAATNSTVTTTLAATLYIAGGPTAGTNQTIIASYGLFNAGQTLLDDRLFLRSGQFSFRNTTGTGSPSTSGTGFQGLTGSFLDTSTAASGTATNFAYASFTGCTLNAQNASVTTTTATVLYVANDVAAGSNQTITNSYGIWNNGNQRIDGRFCLGGNQPTTGANNISKLFITGTDSSISAGPHIAITTSTDQYPLYHQLNFAHNNVFAGFDVYYDGTNFRTSHTTNGYAFYKESNEFRIKYSNSTGAGSTTTLVTGLSMTSTGAVSIPGSLSKGSGTFDIKHPLNNRKRLVHSFIEGPRCDNIYRGTVQLHNGIGMVNLDKDCVEDPECQMTEGTFEALNTNVTYFLQNKTNFDQVIGNINGNILTITSNNPNSNALISWMVIGERNDPHIKEWSRTNSNGRLITEYIK
jgi:hypothetical protein